MISEFELRQLEAEAAVVRAQLPPLQREREREEVALSVLLGRSPRQVFEGTVRVKQAANEAPGAPAVPAGLPSELLLHRPDLVEAERQLAAANARIGVARAEMFPSMALLAAAWAILVQSSSVRALARRVITSRSMWMALGGRPGPPGFPGANRPRALREGCSAADDSATVMVDPLCEVRARMNVFMRTLHQAARTCKQNPKNDP